MGTLDPMASGILPVAVGKSTRLFDYLTDKVKVYVAEFTFGYETDTLDATGTVLKEKQADITKEQIISRLSKFIGTINQVPPKYSANSINGRRGYELARKGIDFTPKTKQVNVYNFELLQEVNKNVFTFKIECGKGTYIRSLCRDLAYELNTLGTMSKLERIQSGVFTKENSITVEQLELNPEKYLIPADSVLNYEQIYLTEQETKKILNGVFEITRYAQGVFYRVYSPTEFLGIGVVENGVLKIKSYVR